MPMYRETIKRLDRQIAELWKDHRSALAKPYSQSPAPREVDPVISMDYFYHADIPVESSAYQVRDRNGWRSVEDRELVEVITRYIADIPLEDPDEVAQLPPLKEALRKRGLTLRWQPLRGGGGYHRLVSSSI